MQIVFFIYFVHDHDDAIYRAEKEGGKQLNEFLSHVNWIVMLCTGTYQLSLEWKHSSRNQKICIVPHLPHEVEAQSILL